MSDPHARMVGVAYEALRWHTQNISDGGGSTIEGMRRALAAAFRAWQPTAAAVERGFGLLNSEELRRAAHQTAAELDGQSDGGQAAS